MKKEKEKIELVFRTSENFDELFDAFQKALQLHIDDVETYKILFANPFLKLYENKLLTKKLCESFPHLCSEIYLWNAEILSAKKYDNEWRKTAVEFYILASDNLPTDVTPLIKLLELYDHEIALPENEIIIKEVKNRMELVEDKKSLYTALADFYKAENKPHLERKYRGLAEKSNN